MTPLLLALWLPWCVAASDRQEVPSASREVIAAVRVHGNQVTPDVQIIQLAGVMPGTLFDSSTLDSIHRRLMASGGFRDVQVLKRYSSIADPLQILIVIVVDEGPVKVVVDEEGVDRVSVVRRRVLTNMMVAPILDVKEGYGVTYGARIAWLGLGGERGRVGVPLMWGGWKRAGLEYERTFESGPLTRAYIGAAVESREHPVFEDDIERDGVSGRAERKLGSFRLAGTAAWQRVRLGALDDRMRSAGVEMTFDTRLDPMLPRNAVYAALSIDQHHIGTRPIVRRTGADIRGYLGLVGQTVLVGRVVREGASRPLPPYLQPVLGGWSTLRGFKPGAFIGDRLVAGSIELRVPLTSPLTIGRFGISLFVDSGKTYGAKERFRDRPLHTGIGVGMWYTVTALQVGVGVAHAQGGGTRGTFGADLRF